jgi:hypothetical protein
MLKEPVESPIMPSSLSDLELLRFAEDFVNGDGMPRAFQREIVRRFAQKIIGSY